MRLDDLESTARPGAGRLPVVFAGQGSAKARAPRAPRNHRSRGVRAPGGLAGGASEPAVIPEDPSRTLAASVGSAEAGNDILCA
jgi:hypothetical protein